MDTCEGGDWQMGRVSENGWRWKGDKRMPDQVYPFLPLILSAPWEGAGDDWPGQWRWLQSVVNLWKFIMLNGLPSPPTHTWIHHARLRLWSLCAELQAVPVDQNKTGSSLVPARYHILNGRATSRVLHVTVLQTNAFQKLNTFPNFWNIDSYALQLICNSIIYYKKNVS